ncbi:NUDIX hydrolase [Cellulomonas sp. PhB143]|uniref:NUDIX hydrolase n=1 Tax=Cellulomonas sp. PhB143 TaxID=2485186 RepID=UPI000FBF9C5A|nr:NUDIX domain-containing protein [Cellulomonas sp. PhB143]ROS79124.1 8-oxo-dGTP pyrophosphatase MutT (NUDIX family) [Cellulomonas sp. PhB143]
MPLSARTADLAATLEKWSPLDPDQAELCDEYVAMLRASEADAPGQDTALRRDGGPEHVTGSCFVLSPDRSRVLLCFHRKGQFWVQLGGHVERDDASVADGAFREAWEESGIDGLVPWSRDPADLNRHALPGAFGRCRVHWDVGYVVVAPHDAVPVVSDESEDVAWFGVDALPDDVPHDFGERLALVLAEVAARG